jgi:hypothetical protein
MGVEDSSPHPEMKMVSTAQHTQQRYAGSRRLLKKMLPGIITLPPLSSLGNIF